MSRGLGDVYKRQIYVNATSAKRVDIIIRHESTLCLKMIGSTGMKYMIEYRKSIEYVNSKL